MASRKDQQRAREESERLVARYKASGQSVREWCETNGVKPNTMWRWLREAKCVGSSEQPTRWLQAVVDVEPAPLQDSGLIVQVGKADIAVKPGFDPELLCSVVRVLSTIC